MRIGIIFAPLLVLGSPALAGGSVCAALLHASESKKPPEIALGGLLSRHFAWGPPGFGENPKTDRYWYPWFLKLDYPVSVVIDDSSAPHKAVVVRRIQVRGANEFSSRFQNYVGSHVVIRGELYPGTAPSDEAAFTLEMRAIRLTRTPLCHPVDPVR